MQQTDATAVPFPALALDEAGVIVAANPLARDLFEHDVVGTQVSDLFDPHDLIPDDPEDLAASLGNGRMLRIPAADDQTRVYAKAEVQGDGGLLVLIRFSTPSPSTVDIDLLARAVDAANNSVVIADLLAADQPLCYVNEGFLSLTGYQRDEVLGRNCRFLQFKDGVHDSEGDGQDQALEKIRTAVAVPEFVGGVVLRNYTKSGTLFYNELYLTPVRDASGRATHMIGVQNDVTVREKSYREQRRLLDRLRGVFAASTVPLGIVARSEDGTLSHVLQNAAAETLGLCEHGDLLRDLSADDRQLWTSAIDQADRDARPVRFDMTTKDGRTYEVLLSPVAEPGSHRLLYVASDVTDGRDAAEDLLHVSNRQLQRVAQDIHDGVGQSLVGASMLAAALVRDLKGQPQAEEAERLQRLIALSLGKLRSFALGLDPVDLDRVTMGEALVRLGVEVEDVLGVRVVVRDEIRNTDLRGSVKLDLYRVAQEAVTNAVRHGNADVVTLTLSRGETEIVLDIADDGRGFLNKNQTGGMGLRTMKARARRHQGDLLISEIEDGGTLVRLTLPADHVTEADAASTRMANFER